MKKLTLSLISIALCGCFGSEKDNAQEKENITQITEIKKNEMQKRKNKLKSEILTLINGICKKSRTESHGEDFIKYALAQENATILQEAFEKNSEKVKNILKTYQLEVSSNTENSRNTQKEIENLEDKIQQQKKRTASEIININEFKKIDIILARKFDQDSDGNSFYEAFDFSNNRKIVAITPIGVSIDLPYRATIYAEDIGDRPFTSTVSNAFHSFEKKEYLRVLKIASDSEFHILTNANEQKLQNLKQQLNQLHETFQQHINNERLTIITKLSPIIKDIEIILDSPASCKIDEDPQKPDHNDKILTPQKITNESKQSYTLCKEGLKSFVIKEVGVYTLENESAISESCQKNLKGALCFINKIKDMDFVSSAERSSIENQCGLPINPS